MYPSFVFHLFIYFYIVTASTAHSLTNVSFILVLAINLSFIHVLLCFYLTNASWRCVAPPPPRVAMFLYLAGEQGAGAARSGASLICRPALTAFVGLIVTNPPRQNSQSSDLIIVQSAEPASACFQSCRCPWRYLMKCIFHFCFYSFIHFVFRLLPLVPHGNCLRWGWGGGFLSCQDTRTLGQTHKTRPWAVPSLRGCDSWADRSSDVCVCVGGDTRRRAFEYADRLVEVII